ncbi:hypothetical protein [Segetibacter koreensis]|uniref:hypothetical protein n=1 Tax=Segetibacter koreensis TaxID=398037 RepID=UPI000374E77C|nr:hypothetical protein [Segetibacter koreensis]
MEIIVIVFQLVLLLFHQATTLVNFYPFNNVRNYTIKERLLECFVNGVIMAVPVIGWVFRIKWMVTASLFIYPVLLAGEYLNWWKHYLFNPTEEWIKTYDRIFKETIIVLPPIKNNPIPNLEHTILHSLTLETTVVTYIYYFTR